MNLLDTLTPSNFRPNNSQARKVTFKSAEDIKADELAKIEKEQVKEQLKTNAAYRMRLSRWRKEKEKAQKRVTRCEWFLNEALKALKGVEDAKPLPPVVGVSDKHLLESVDVVTTQEIPVFTQSLNQ